MINTVILVVAIVFSSLVGWCAYWAGRNDEREFWEREKRK